MRCCDTENITPESLLMNVIHMILSVGNDRFTITWASYRLYDKTRTLTNFLILSFTGKSNEEIP